MSDNKGVMIYGEVTEGKISSIAAELLGCGRKTADDLGQELSVALLGSGVSDLAQEAIALGADKVYVVDDPLLADYQTDSYIVVMEKVAKQVMPQVILMGQTGIGRDLAPRLAFRLGTAATLDCVGIEVDPNTKRLLQTKPVYGGNAQAVYTYDTDPQIATIRAKAMAPAVPDSSRKGEVVKIEAGLDPSAIRTKVLEKVKEEVEGIRLEDAAVIVSGGRGIGGAEGFAKLTELAEALKGAVGASRPACDSGWMPDTAQVGLTGKIVSPDFYLAIGISGSSQHLAGCSGAKTIVAINKDPEANIFKVARYGIVGDWKQVIPAFTQKVKELLAK
ncbi:MAG: electron transfer flavoprotein subunit alpha/FixB family protein [Dehalococcoidales bacterium]|nr:electron transfer flavoprotein subunit alpha/FixB family protein [Dehalococcoidales bacterium]MDZ4230941.1 electron transfer flavoprotein subunit alpha/FixB family protein [Dehalococcoidales bacterium]